MPSEYNPTDNVFSFQRLRFDFGVLEPQRFAEGRAGNIFRGALGCALREGSPEAYFRFFEPRRISGGGPSGFANPPRPFVLRAAHLDGRRFERGESFHVDLHLFKNAPPDPFINAMEKISMGRLVKVSRESLALSLENRRANVQRLTVRFATLTELKTAGTLSRDPDFSILFSRANSRIRALCEHELALDFAGMIQRAREIVLVSQNLVHERRSRTSRKTGETHPLSGFRGEVCYEGDLDEFVALLEAARWTGVGRQTVWGKGAIELRYD